MLTIKIQSTAHYLDRISIDGVKYLFRFDYYDRTSSWYMSIAASDGNFYATGRKLSVGWNPLVRDKNENLPTGALYLSSTVDPVGRNGFDNESTSLVYFDADEVEAMGANADQIEDVTIEAVL